MAECCYGGRISVISALSNVQLACNKEWIAAPHKDKSFAIWKHGNSVSNPVVFTGHKKCVTALCFGNKSEPSLLASASEDCVIVWYFDENSSYDGEFCSETRNIIVARDLGYVQHVSFNSSDELISICVDNEVWVIEIETCDLRTVIDGHHGIVNASRFCPVQDSLLVTISEDRTFKVYDVQQKSVLHHSPIISAYSFLSLAFHSNGKEVSLGSSDGIVRIFSLVNRYNCLRTLDLNKYFAQHLVKEKEDNVENPEEPGLAVIGMCYKCCSKNENILKDDYHATSELLEEADILLCATTGALFVVNLNTCQPIKIVDFREPITASSTNSRLSELSLVSLCGSCEFYKQEEKIICILGSLFEASLHILHIILPLSGATSAKTISTEGCFMNSGNEDETSQLVSADISVLSRAPLCENSPLKAELVPKVQDKRAKGNVKKAQTTTKKTKGPVENKPVTFKMKIKSSGYTTAPRTKMFSPKLNNPAKQSKVVEFPPKPLAQKKQISSVKESQPSDYNIPTELKEKVSLCSVPVAINQIKFSGNGKKLACGLANHTAHILDVAQTSKQRAYSGHNGGVQSIDFSHDGQYLLTSSKDNTACLWITSNSEPILTFKNQNQAAVSSSKDNPVFFKGIGDALFYYLDKFILLSSGNSLFMYKYYLDFTKDDLKRYQSKSHYKLVTSLPLEKSQSVTSFTCINDFYSYIVLCAGSDRSLEVFDVNVNQSVRRLEDVHTRNVHCIKINQGSKTFSLPAQSYDLFLTAAIADGVKIWDLRSSRCVRKYEGHVNRSHPVGIAWSPCAKYFAVGSENKSAYIYDVRHSHPSQKLSRHTDAVFDVAFHPITSQLATATLDGKLHFYSGNT